jgi:hyperpolarization activated cyclic nucleotide-gated potassium channel 1
MTTVGYGDISAYTEFEKVLGIGWMMYGVCFFSFTIGSLSSILVSADSKENVLSQKLSVIDEFCAEAKLEKEFRIRLRHALTFSTQTSGFSWAEK